MRAAGSLAPLGLVLIVAIALSSSLLASIMSPGASTSVTTRLDHSPAITRPVGGGSLATVPGLAEFNVTLKESGLASGTVWSVIFNGQTYLGRSQPIVFQIANGTYLYTVGPVQGYNISTTNGLGPWGALSVTSNVTRTVYFTLENAVVPSYSLTFVETGLPQGTTWSVTLNGTTTFSSSSTVVFQVTNGSWSWGVPTVTTYRASPATGNVVVSGAPSSVTVRFSSPEVLGLSPAEGYFVATTGLIVVLLFLAFLILIIRRHRRQTRSRPPTDPTPESQSQGPISDGRGPPGSTPPPPSSPSP